MNNKHATVPFLRMAILPPYCWIVFVTVRMDPFCFKLGHDHELVGMTESILFETASSGIVGLFAQCSHQPLFVPFRTSFYKKHIFSWAWMPLCIFRCLYFKEMMTSIRMWVLLMELHEMWCKCWNLLLKIESSWFECWQRTGNGRIETSDNPSQIPKVSVTEKQTVKKDARAWHAWIASWVDPTMCFALVTGICRTIANSWTVHSSMMQRAMQAFTEFASR